MNNKLVIHGTRISFDLMLMLLASCMTLEEIAEREVKLLLDENIGLRVYGELKKKGYGLMLLR